MANNNESLHQALADLEMLQAAYPDEVQTPSDTQFPLHCSFHLSDDSFICLEFTDGYPMTSGVQISKYRSPQKDRMDAVVRAIRTSAAECLNDKVEGAFVCCAAALETWNDYHEYTTTNDEEIGRNGERDAIQPPKMSPPVVEWITADEPLVDRKSSFLAHACRVTAEQQVHDALHQLIDGSSKLQRASHNMVCCVVVSD